MTAMRAIVAILLLFSQQAAPIGLPWPMGNDEVSVKSQGLGGTMTIASGGGRGGSLLSNSGALPGNFGSDFKPDKKGRLRVKAAPPGAPTRSWSMSPAMPGPFSIIGVKAAIREDELEKSASRMSLTSKGRWRGTTVEAPEIQTPAMREELGKVASEWVSGRDKIDSQKPPVTRLQQQIDGLIERWTAASDGRVQAAMSQRKPRSAREQLVSDIASLEPESRRGTPFPAGRRGSTQPPPPPDYAPDDEDMPRREYAMERLEEIVRYEEMRMVSGDPSSSSPKDFPHPQGHASRRREHQRQRGVRTRRTTSPIEQDMVERRIEEATNSRDVVSERQDEDAAPQEYPGASQDYEAQEYAAASQEYEAQEYAAASQEYEAEQYAASGQVEEYYPQEYAPTEQEEAALRDYFARFEQQQRQDQEEAAGEEQDAGAYEYAHEGQERVDASGEYATGEQGEFAAHEENTVEGQEAYNAYGYDVEHQGRQDAPAYEQGGDDQGLFDSHVYAAEGGDEAYGAEDQASPYTMLQATGRQEEDEVASPADYHEYEIGGQGVESPYYATGVQGVASPYEHAQGVQQQQQEEEDEDEVSSPDAYGGEGHEEASPYTMLQAVERQEEDEVASPEHYGAEGEEEAREEYAVGEEVRVEEHAPVYEYVDEEALQVDDGETMQLPKIDRVVHFEGQQQQQDVDVYEQHLWEEAALKHAVEEPRMSEVSMEEKEEEEEEEEVVEERAEASSASDKGREEKYSTPGVKLDLRLANWIDSEAVMLGSQTALDDLAVRLDSEGLCEMWVDPDGDSFYIALTQQLALAPECRAALQEDYGFEPEENQEQDVQAALSRYPKAAFSSRQDVAGFLSFGPNLLAGMSPAEGQQYLEAMRQPGAWTGLREVQSAAMLYQVKIVTFIVTERGLEERVFDPIGEPRATLRFVKCGSHFWSVVPILDSLRDSPIKQQQQQATAIADPTSPVSVSPQRVDFHDNTVPVDSSGERTFNDWQRKLEKENQEETAGEEVAAQVPTPKIPMGEDEEKRTFAEWQRQLRNTPSVVSQHWTGDMYAATPGLRRDTAAEEEVVVVSAGDEQSHVTSPLKEEHGDSSDEGSTLKSVKRFMAPKASSPVTESDKLPSSAEDRLMEEFFRESMAMATPKAPQSVRSQPPRRPTPPPPADEKKKKESKSEVAAVLMHMQRMEEKRERQLISMQEQHNQRMQEQQAHMSEQQALLVKQFCDLVNSQARSKSPSSPKKNATSASASPSKTEAGVPPTLPEPTAHPERATTPFLEARLEAIEKILDGSGGRQGFATPPVQAWDAVGGGVQWGAADAQQQYEAAFADPQQAYEGGYAPPQQAYGQQQAYDWAYGQQQQAYEGAYGAPQQPYAQQQGWGQEPSWGVAPQQQQQPQWETTTFAEEARMASQLEAAVPPPMPDYGMAGGQDLSGGAAWMGDGGSAWDGAGLESRARAVERSAEEASERVRRAEAHLEAVLQEATKRRGEALHLHEQLDEVVKLRTRMQEASESLTRLREREKEVAGKLNGAPSKGAWERGLEERVREAEAMNEALEERLRQQESVPGKGGWSDKGVSWADAYATADRGHTPPWRGGSGGGGGGVGGGWDADEYGSPVNEYGAGDPYYDASFYPPPGYSPAPFMSPGPYMSPSPYGIEQVTPESYGGEYDTDYDDVSRRVEAELPLSGKGGGYLDDEWRGGRAPVRREVGGYGARGKSPVGRSSVQRVLRDVGLQDYERLVLANGWDTLDRLRLITEDDLVDFGVKRGHARGMASALTREAKRALRV